MKHRTIIRKPHSVGWSEQAAPPRDPPRHSAFWLDPQIAKMFDRKKKP
jgi:hypothetical protein